MCNKENTMKYMILVMSISSIFFAGCSSNKDAYEYEHAKQFEDVKPLEAAPPAWHDDGDVENVRQSEDEKPLEQITSDAKPAERIIVSVATPGMVKGGITTEDQKAKDAVDTALKALGGADIISDIKSLIIKRTSLISPDSIMSEYRILLPDNFIEVLQGSVIRNQFPEGITYTGISQGKFFLVLQNGVNREAAERTVGGVFWGYAKTWSLYVLGILMRSDFVPVAISSGSNPNIFNLTTNTGHPVLDMPGQIEFDPETGYPLFIRYTNIIGNMREFEYRDRFPVNGIMVPHHITINGGQGMRLEVQINPKLSLKDFEGP